jgi:hypothetical protein
MGLILERESCRDCPRLNIKEVSHWLLGYQKGYEYICTKANRNIYPNEGVKPPPDWCPIREKKDE